MKEYSINPATQKVEVREKQSVSEPPVALQQMVSVQWIKECAQCASVLSIALACTGQWQAALGATAASWIIYLDARASTAR